jgi:ribonuclease P protein component
MKKPFSLSKHERIKSKKTIDTLFLSGEAFFVFPYKVIYTLQPLDESNKESGLRILISVPKRIHKRANRRNRIKRLSKEVYRLQKNELKMKLTERALSMNIMMIYTAPDEIPFVELQGKMQRILLMLLERIQKD